MNLESSIIFVELFIKLSFELGSGVSVHELECGLGLEELIFEWVVFEVYMQVFDEMSRVNCEKCLI